MALAHAVALLDSAVHVVDTRTEGDDQAEFAGDTCHAQLDAIQRGLNTPRRIHGVVLNRDWPIDLAARLEHLAACPSDYPDKMGSRQRIATVFTHLAAACADLRDRIIADLGAEPPKQIAIGTLAQLLAFAHQRPVAERGDASGQRLTRRGNGQASRSNDGRISPIQIDLLHRSDAPWSW